MLPVIQAFMAAHQLPGVTVVADAGMVAEADQSTSANPERTSKSPMQTRQMASVSPVMIVDTDAVASRSRERNKQS